MAWLECCGGIHKTMPCKVCIFVLLLCLNAADVAMDWFLYFSFKNIEKGFLYVPLSNSLLCTYFGFTMFGSVIFLAEIINAYRKMFRNPLYVDMDILSAVSLWCADVPQITINVVVATCRGKLLSGYQITKGAVVISGCFIRVLIVVLRYCSKKCLKKVRSEKSAKSRRRVAAMVFVGAGVVWTSICSILVFIFASYHLEDGKLTPHNPDRHFKDVGIFTGMGTFLPGTNLSKKTWIKLTDIQTVRNSSKVLVFKYTIENGNNQSVMSLGNNLYSENVQITNCYRLDIMAEVEIITEVPASSCASTNSSNSTDSLFWLWFQEPIDSSWSNPRIFGDIIFNWNGTHRENIKENPLRYFGYKFGVVNSSQLIFPESNLTDVRDVWRTGNGECMSTGNIAPDLRHTLKFPNN